MPFYLWSTTASSNANDDPSINWAEGQAPSSINDSARATMAALKGWGNDISGRLLDTGTSTAYVVTSNQGFDSLTHMNGAAIAFVPANTSGGACTLNVDGLGAKPLRSAPSVEIASGALVAGTPYVCTYNNSDGAFYLQNYFVNPYQVPLGSFMPYCGTTAPNTAFAFPYGQAISRTTYATLFSLCGTTFGVGDGSTTFNIPDLRGKVTAFLDNMGGTAAGLIGTSVATDNGTINGQTLGSTGGSAKHALILSETPSFSYTPAGSVSSTLNLSNGSILATGNGGGNAAASGSGFINYGNSFSITSTFSGNAATLGGSNGAHAIMQPTMMLNCILRII